MDVAPFISMDSFFINLLFPPISGMSVSQSALRFKVRGRCFRTSGGSICAVPCRSFDKSKQHGIPPHKTGCRFFCPSYHLIPLSYLSSPGILCHWQTATYPICNRIGSAKSKLRYGYKYGKSLFCLPGRPLPDPPGINGKTPFI